jgi:hypothetical protein
MHVQTYPGKGLRLYFYSNNLFAFDKLSHAEMFLLQVLKIFNNCTSSAKLLASHGHAEIIYIVYIHLYWQFVSRYNSVPMHCLHIR